MRDKPLPELISLSEAAAELGLKISSLRTEIRKGRLTPVEIAGRFYLTRESLGEMIKACLVKPRGQDSTSDDTRQPEHPGSSSMENPNVALDAANMTLQELKNNLRNTSRANMSRRAGPRTASTGY